MNAHPIDNKDAQINDKEQLSNLIDIMGLLDGGINQEEFLAVKDEMMESGITSEGLLGLFETDILKNLLNRPQIPVQIQRLTDSAKIPTYSHDTDACADIYADEDITIEPGETHPVNTGIALAIPDGFVVHVYPRSGLSVNTKLRLANSVGIIDAGYRDELKVPIWNAGDVPYRIEKGMRIAQMNIMQCPLFGFEEVEDIKEIPGDRSGGFGSSGLFEMANGLNEQNQKEIISQLEALNGEV